MVDTDKLLKDLEFLHMIHLHNKRYNTAKALRQAKEEIVRLRKINDQQSIRS